ncbi:MAG TPA: FMN-binding protein [Firmicutes bacterium]|nr:FMN-binding protein [Bacillota bacterium]
MKQWLKPLLSLLAVTAISVALLFGMDAVTRTVIEKQEMQAVHKAFSGVISGDTWEAVDTAGESDIKAAYRVLDKDGSLLGYAVTVSVKGYGGEMQVHTALSPDASRFLGLRVGDNQETQGYGSRVTEEAFYSQFNSLAAPASLDGYTGLENGTGSGGSSSAAAMQDGSYRAEQAEYVQGYQYFVEITVEGGRITAVNWDALKEGSDRTKKQESEAGEYVMTEDGPLWHEQAKTMEEALIDAQDPAALVYDADTGKTDAYTGVSVDVSEFVSLAGRAVQQAKAGSAATALWKDGSYRAQQDGYDQGYQYFVEITVEGGRITAVNWDALKEGSDRTKKQESEAGEYVMTEDGPLWHEQAKTMEEALINAQDPAALVYDADTGKTDAYTGVSVDVSEFVSLASEALASAGAQGSGDESGGRVENAATGSGEVDGVTGATVSSKAVVKAANRAYEFAAALAGGSR